MKAPMSMALSAATLVGTCWFRAEASAQNLVPNGSFEEYTECPPTFSYIQNVVGWEFAYWISPDFFHTCHTGLSAGVPFNAAGYQYPSEGSGYTGIITYDADNPFVREVMGAQLNEPLVVGVPVYISFKTAVGGFGSWDGGAALYTCKGVGLKFFIDIPPDPQAWVDYMFPNEAALALQQVATDTAIWYTSQGMYVPDSAYTHVLIANFFADSLSEPTLLDSTGFANTAYAYAFIDEVCVAYDPAVCGIAQSVSENHTFRGVHASNPFDENLTLWFSSAPDGPLHVSVFDSSGRLVWQRTEVSSSKRLLLKLPELPGGLFVLQLSDDQGPYSPLRLVHPNP